MNLPNYFPSNLTDDQSLAIQKIEAFLSSQTNCFLLKGYAGTGKTFLMEGLVKYFSAVGRNCRLMAPTGRAAMIIGDKTKSDAYTIHKSIYNFDELEDDEHTFRMRFKLNLNEDSVNSVYLIDESSMISDIYNEDEFFIFGSGYLLKDLFSFVDFKYRNDAKIIFIGDNAQLPPIGMSFSPALEKEYLLKKYQITTDEFELKQVVRQREESGILNSATHLRENLENGQFNRFEINHAYSDITNLSTEEFNNIYFRTVSDKPSDNTIVITHSNKQAHEYNTEIRGKFFPNQPYIQAGDVVMITKNNYNYVVDLFNGQFAEIIEASPIPEPSKIIRFYKKGGKKAEVTFVFRDVIIKVKDVKGQFCQLNCKIIDNFLNSGTPRLTQDEQQALYVDFKKRHPNLKIKTREFKDALKADKYFNALQVKYGYAITCHKAQGGEWKNAFVNMQVYMRVLSKGFFRWAYTAISRAKEHLFCIGVTQYTPLSEFIVHPITILNRKPTNQFFVPPEFYEVETSIEFDNPNLKAKFIEISKKLKDQDVAISITHLNWIERYNFSRNGQNATIDLNYGKKGFTGRLSIISSTDQEFAQFIRKKISEPLLFKIDYSPEKSWQQELYEFMEELTRDEDIKITNILTEPYCDKYFLLTDSDCAFIEFWYKQKGIYTKVLPFSTKGEQDLKLQSLIQKLS